MGRLRPQARGPLPRSEGRLTSEPKAAAPARREFHIPSLDGIRAVSFLVVFVAHAGYGNVIPGGFGVTVFFFLSGFLITTLLRMELVGTGDVSLRDFYLRRVLRILPPFYTVLAFDTLLVLFGVLSGPLWRGPMLALVFHFSNYWNVFHGALGQPPGTAVYWSLAVEEHFYLVFPALFLLLQAVLGRRWRAQSVVLLIGCAVVLAWRFVLVLLLHSAPDRTYLASDTRVDSILFGCALALGANPMLDEPGPASPLLRRLLLPLGIAMLLATFLYRADWFRETLRYSLQGVALLPIFIAAMRNPGWWPFRWLNRPLPRRIGVLSYSLYLTHHAMLYAFERNWPSLPVPVRGALALLVSLFLAECINRGIEKPCAKLRKRLGHTPSAPASTVVAV
jgi:peptidoglycan/LPS O-acetylase OafA/YrhL